MGRKERKYGWTADIALGSISKCLNKGGSHRVSSPYLCPQAFSQIRLKISFPAPSFCLSWISFCGSWFSWLHSRELSCLFWKWWVVLCGFVTGRQVLKCSVVKPQNLPCSFLHWVISLLHPGCFQACFPAIYLCLVYSVSCQFFFLNFWLRRRSPEISFIFPRAPCMPSTWKHLSVVSCLCGGIIVQVPVRVLLLPPLLDLTEKLLNMLNAQKLFLSAMRLVTGFVGSRCQFQTEPEVLIKPSSLGFFFHFYQRLPNSSPVCTSKSFHSFSCCHPWSVAAQDGVTLAESCFFLWCCSGLCRARALPEGPGHFQESRCAQPLQRHTKSTPSPRDRHQQPGSWLAGALLPGTPCSHWCPWRGCLAELWTSSSPESSSRAVGMRVTSQGGRRCSPRLGMEPGWAAARLLPLQI